MAEDLQYRLYNISITPPGDAWSKIVEQLDKEAQEKLSLKMQQAVLMPPADAWQNILNVLNEGESTHQTKIIPLTRRRNQLAAAAIAAGIIILAGLYYFMAGDGASDTTAERTVQPTRNISPSQNNRQAPSTASSLRNIRPASRMVIAANMNPLAAFASNNRASRIRYASLNNNSLEASTQNALSTDGVVGQQVSEQPKTYITPKAYLTVQAPNGQPTKISAKFADAVGYVLNNEPLDNMSSALKSISWKKRFSSWSNKLMMNAGFIPAATNFFDIVELEELLKD
ncbi:MAG: hypothetical protein WCF67_13580 [Chitinophagaceae bacterium]